MLRRFLPVLALCLAWAGSVNAHGLLIPADKTLPPLAMVNHKVTIGIDDQVAITTVEQTFRNHTSRQLEATYVFPVPKGASVNKFTMLVNGKEQAGELLEAAKARQIYTDIVRRTQDPGLLEYLGNNIFQLKVFPIEPKSDQKVTLSYTSVAPRDGDLVEYIYPLKTDGKATRTLEDFAIQATIKSQHPILNVYSPTHAINLTRTGDKEVKVNFARDQALLDKDFQLFYSLGDKDVGLTLLAHRPLSDEKGHFMLLLSPRPELSREQTIPRDLVLVMDTSGSMAGEKIEQARKALQHVLGNLTPKDRFGLINFSTTVNKYRDTLVEASADRVDHAMKWVSNLQARGGTAINDALQAALEMRPKGDEGRSFTIVFFTDGQPTIGETNPEKIVKNVEAKNSANTRIFTFGVGHDDGINATLLDQLAERTRALSTFVQPGEDIAVKTASLYSKISHPILANLKLSVGDKVRIEEMYPPQLPDLFHGGQVVVLGRYEGSGPVAVKLTGSIGKIAQEFVYEVNFPAKSAGDKDFVEQVWARRKVGYLIDQIRANGEKKELVDEVVALAKKYGITTPYTSYLIVPDGVAPVVNAGPGRRPLPVPGPVPPPPALGGLDGGSKPLLKVADFARQAQAEAGQLAQKRGQFELDRLNREAAKGEAANGKEGQKLLEDAKTKADAYQQALSALRQRDKDGYQAGRTGVQLSAYNNSLKDQTRLEQTAQKQVGGRTVMEIGGVWIDEGFDAKMTTLTVKAMSNAYFRMLERHPMVKEVFRLGNHLVWITPNGTALVIDTSDGKTELSDKEIDELFVARK